MSEYPKIETLFERKEDFTVDIERLRHPVIATISQWDVSEKVDGTNIRVLMDEQGNVRFGGRTDNAQIPADLIMYLMNTFARDKMNAAFAKEGEPLPSVVLYGEGYGAGIQKGGYYRKDKSFRLFDVLIITVVCDIKNPCPIHSTHRNVTQTDRATDVGSVSRVITETGSDATQKQQSAQSEKVPSIENKTENASERSLPSTATATLESKESESPHEDAISIESSESLLPNSTPCSTRSAESVPSAIRNKKPVAEAGGLSHSSLTTATKADELGDCSVRLATSQSTKQSLLLSGSAMPTCTCIQRKWWLDWENTCDVADKLNILTVPHLGRWSLPEIVNGVRNGITSKVACEDSQNMDCRAEGIVARPIETLFYKNGKRLIIKLKTKDFGK